MPELPEVETIVRELDSSCRGMVFKNCVVLNRSSLKTNDRELSEISGKKILGVVRRGKFIIFNLSGNKKMIVHLRMTGRLLWSVEPGREKFVRAVFNFNDGGILFFADVRKFGGIWFGNEVEVEKAAGIHRIGPEPVGITSKKFESLFRGRKGRLKHLLLRQDLLAGIGNIYADEICFRCGLHPERDVETLQPRNYREIQESVVECLKEGIKHCGVSVSDFTGTRGDLGKHQLYLKVYGRCGEKCYRCRSTIEKKRVGGRGTNYCPVCQK